ncbi:MAG: hypothetical protein K5897_11140 [Eubacterium sp.]|nr:hypothetical protein [Eubacterium sp.]
MLYGLLFGISMAGAGVTLIARRRNQRGTK